MNKSRWSPPLHVDLRHGVGWPRPPSAGRRRVGWLSYREYDLIELRERFGVTNIYDAGTKLKLKSTAAERMYHSLIECGMIGGTIEEFFITPMGKILWDMTDQYILQLELEDEEDVA